MRRMLPEMSRKLSDRRRLKRTLYIHLAIILQSRMLVKDGIGARHFGKETGRVS